MNSEQDLLRENQELKEEIERLKKLLREQASSTAPASNYEALETLPKPKLKVLEQLKQQQDHAACSDDSDSERSEETTSGLRVQPLFDESGQVKEVVAFVVNDIPQAKKKKKKTKKKNGSATATPISSATSTPIGTPSRNRRKYLKKKEKRAQKKRPTVVANLDTDALLESVVPDFLSENPKMEDKTTELKVKLLKEARRFNRDIQLIGDSETLEQLLEREMSKKTYTAFYLVNLGALVEKFVQWTSLLPRVEPFYAVKSNPDINIIRTLQYLGTGFDCASTAELEEVMNLGVLPSKIIFANPCKGPDHIVFAKSQGINLMTFDSKAELEKIIKLHPHAKLVLRILPDDRHSLMPFGTKFGASFKESVKLIALCRQMGVELVGVSFHVGSGCFSVDAWVDAVKLARKVFDEAEKEGFQLSLLDLGGGWPGTDNGPITMEDIREGLGALLDELFPSDKVKIIAEPGRFFCTSCYTLAVTVNSRRERFIKNTPEPGDSQTIYSDEEEEHDESMNKEILYYLSDGIYGSFNNIVFDHAKPSPIIMKDTSQGNLAKSCLFGPTCDSVDVICKDITLPELEIGDWLYFMNMGAYTVASASSFNGFKPPNACYVICMSQPESTQEQQQRDRIMKAQLLQQEDRDKDKERKEVNSSTTDGATHNNNGHHSHQTLQLQS